MAYTTINKSTDNFNTVLYTGTGATQTISGVGHQPDFIWVKQRGDAGYDHSLHNSVSGLLKQLISNSTSAEITNTDTVTSNNSDGFVLGADSAGPNANSNNQNTKTYAAWNWKANGTGSSNSDGDITSTVSANTTAGFSIVKFTANGTNNGTIGHGLGVAPKVVLYKRTDSTGSWYWLYKYVDGSLDFLQLDSTAAKTDLTLGTYGFTTSTTFTNLGLGNGQEIIAYCFAEKTGYSKFGSYTGNGNADGTFVYTGFKPTFLMVKRTDSTSNWTIVDSIREPTNNISKYMDVNLNTAEGNYTGWSFLSNGFKFVNTDAGINANGGTFIYMAFGQSLVGSNNVPCTAR